MPLQLVSPIDMPYCMYKIKRVYVYNGMQIAIEIEIREILVSIIFGNSLHIRLPATIISCNTMMTVVW